MAIESAVTVRRVALAACLIFIFGLLFSGVASAQLPTQGPIKVTVGSVVPFGHGSTGAWSQIYAAKFAPNGTLVFMDSAASNVYQLAPGASTPTLVVGPAPSGGSSNGSTLEPAGTYWNGGIAIDANNTLYITDRYGSAVHFLRVPYDSKSGTWLFSAAANWTTGPQVVVNGLATAVSPQDICVGDDGTFYVSWSITGEIDKFTVDANGNASAVTPIVTGLRTMVSNIAVDHAGNLFFIENAYAAPGSRVTGIREIPANAKLPLTGDTTGTLEQGFTRIDDASEGLNGIKGVSFDAAGNMYVSLANNSSYGGNVSGVLMVPNEGTPKAPNLVWADKVYVAPVYSGFPVAVDPRGFLWIPTGGGGSNWTTPGSIGAKCDTTDNTTINATCTASSMVLWAMGSANLGKSPVGTASTPTSVIYSFTDPITPASLSFAQPGGANFALVDNPNADPSTVPAVPPCTAGTAYPGFSGVETSIAQYSFCVAYVQMNAKGAGAVAGELQILDANNAVVPGSNAYLSGEGQGPAISVLFPTLQQTTASGLHTPKQVAGDAWGNTYVADSGLKAIEVYPAGSVGAVGKTLGTGLTAPTGVAVDGAGDVFIGDSGKLIEIPFINGALATKQQTTLLTGLGNHLNLAADSVGNVFIADADNARVLKVSNPQVSSILLQNMPTYSFKAVKWTAPSAIATDVQGDVFVADGTDLWELTPFGGAAHIGSALPAPVTGIAVDPSESVMLAGATGLLWIPAGTSGGLNVNGQIAVAAGVGQGNAFLPISVAMDGFQNAFVTYGSGATAGLAQLGVGGVVDFGQIVPFLESDQEAQIVNVGNQPLTFADFSKDVFTGTNAADYAVATAADSPACDPKNPTPAGSACYFAVGLSPSGAGPSSASLAILTDAANAPTVNLGLSGTAVADDRMPTQTSVSITPTSGVVYPGAVTITVTVASIGNGTPTGKVVLKVTGQPKQEKELANSSASFSYSKLSGGAYNVSANYGGIGTVGGQPYPSCAQGTECYAASAGKASFTVNRAKPDVTVGTPQGSPKDITVWAGNTYLKSGTDNTITATVTSTVGTPNGTVSFLNKKANNAPLGPDIPLDADGNAKFHTTNLPLGVYDLTVRYNGDVNYAVTPVDIPEFLVISPSVQVTADPAATSTKAGTPTTVNLILKPLVGFANDVQLQCVGASLPQYSECTFAYAPGSNQTVGVGNGTDSTATAGIAVTLSTNVPVNGVTATAQNKPAPWSLAGIFGLGLLGLIGARKRLNRFVMLLLAALMLSGAFLGITACTNSGYSTPPPMPKVATPAGTYNVQIITVDASNGQQNSLTTPVFTLPVTVQ